MTREEKTCKRKKDEIRRERKSDKITRNGGYGCSRKRCCRHKRNRAVDTAETGTEGAAGIRATGTAGAVIPTPAAIFGPSEVSASGEISMQMKRKYRKKIKGKEDTYP